MDALSVSPSRLASLVIALSFAVGLNTYATVASLGIMARLHWLVLPAELDTLQNTWIIVVSAALFAGEFVADKIPGFDLFWNALHTFIRIPAAALLAYAAGSRLSPEAHLLVTLAGATFAAIAHSSKTAARLVVTPSPEPVSNIALSGAEDAFAIGLTWVATHYPRTAGISIVVLSLALIGVIWWGFRRIRTGFKRLLKKQRAT